MPKLIENVNNTNDSQKKRLRQFFGYRTNKSVLDDIGGLDLGTTPQTRLNNAYTILAQEYNADILEGRREKKIEMKKKKQEERKLKLLKDTKNNMDTIKNSTYILQSDIKQYENMTGQLSTEPDKKILKNFYDTLKKIYKKGTTINIVKEGGLDDVMFKINFSYTFTDNFTKDYKQIRTKYIQIDSEQNKLENDEINYTLYINVGEEIEGKNIIQAFKDGITNCFFTPIIEWCDDKLEHAKTKGTIDRYRAMKNKLIKDELLYRDKGVDKDDISLLSNKYQINVEVNTPFQKEFIKVKCNKKALTTFKFINTRINHIEHNKIVNLAPTIISIEEMNEVKLSLKDEYHTYTRNQTGCSSISTLHQTFRLDNEYNDTINEFEKETGLIDCYLDDFIDVEISKFVRQGVHFNECIDFREDEELIDRGALQPPLPPCARGALTPQYDPTMDNYDELISMSNEDKQVNAYYHIDMRKAYAGFKSCKYYKGFVGKITDYRPTNKIIELGYYRIEKLNFDDANPLLKKYNDTMKIYNDNIYPSFELEFLQDNGVTFNIIEGCWGTNLDFEFTDYMLNEKYNGVPIYSKYTGSMYYYSEYKDFYMNCNKDLAEHIVGVSDYDMVSYNHYNDEIKVSYKKQHNNHLSHVCGFITGYMRLNVMEQLFKIDIDNVVRVCVDGIYYDGDKVECVNVFRDKPEPMKSNSPSDSYISNYECDLPFCENTGREHYLKELHAGVGGSGKTHLNIYDKGLIRKLFVAPSWKLSRNKNLECGIANQVWANICCKDPEKINYIRQNFNVLIIDEISMMSDEMKFDIFKLYPDMKIIMCGDVGYQLPQFADELTTFKEVGFDKIIRYTINRRCKCEKLQDILDLCREMITDKFLYTTIKKLIKQRITKDELKNKYCKKDMILCRTHTKKDIYTEMFKNIEKYYILKTDKKYCKGEIVYDKPDEEYYKVNVDYETRHAYTIHSIQGETAQYNLYIDDKYIEPEAIYTALSRAKYLSQIYIIQGD